MFVTRREKKGNRSDVKEYVYTVKRGLTIKPEDLKLSRKVFNHISVKASQTIVPAHQYES
jgi:hypothetical protein